MRFLPVLLAFLMACGGTTSQQATSRSAADAQGAHQPDQRASAAAEHGHAEHGHAEHGHAEHGHAEHGHAGPAPLGHRFESADDYAARLENPERDAWQKPEHVVSLMQIRPGMTVADVGAGTGYFLPYLSRAVGPGGKILGLDIEPDMVRYMKERAAREGLANVEARRVATDDPGLAPGSVDRVLIVNTWHHIPARRAYAGKLAGALAPGGIVYIVDFHMDSAHGPPRRHRLPVETVLKELQDAGLQAEILAEELSEQYVVAARLP
jgi:SAM-dependent methyltransferase